LLVDRVFHAEDMETLKALGATDRPVRREDPREDPWFEEYCEVMYASLCAALPVYSSRPRRSSVAVTGASVPGPLHLLRELSPEGRAAFARELPEGGVPPWTVQRTTGQYESIKVKSPLIWMLAKEGKLLTSLGVRRVRDAVAQELDVHRALLPVADVPAGTARALDLPAAFPEIPEGLWTELLQRADTGSDSAFVGAAYAFLAEAAPAGTLGGRERTFRCRQGESWASLPAASIAVTCSRDEHELLSRERVPALLVPNESAAQLLVDECGFSRPGTLLTEEVHSVPLTDPVPLTDFFPRLRQRFPESTAWKLAYCSELIKIVSTPDGPREEPLTEAVDGVTVLLCGEHDEESMLAAVDRQLVLRLGPDGRRSLLRLQERDANDRRLQQVREETDLAAKLVLAVGASRLLAALPPGLETADRQLRGVAVDGPRAAELLIAAHGENILQVLAPALLEAEFDVPRQWTGTLRAREFVRSFRFPEAWAGDPETPASAAPYETVPGPRKSLVLHDYQRALVEKIYEHLAKGEDMRAMIQIPTGSGKTRIAAEAGVRAIRDGVIRGPILWITQSRELAEQAIETWSYVWQVEGADQPLRITRMWGGMPDAVPVKDGPQVVVAIDDTAVVRLPKEGYAWLRDCALVIVDEAHFAVPKTYTSILDQLGIDRRGAARPLLGLTATAFRGDSDEETGTLVARFGRKRLDYGVFENDDAYGYLQSIGVLARVEPEELLGGSYSLSAEQVSAMRGTEAMALPADAMRGLERDVERTRRIVQRILGLDPDWPVLVFATSVEHAQVLAALLNDRGRAAGSIDGKTPPNIRRNRVAAFKEGRIRVLTNYKVLTQGFDAPAVRAVVVARPTFSPNTYIQMIGRGLRGELNGGKDSCLILNVKDNIENFGRDLAYTRMEHLWRGGKG
jgi:superfamily II DNA or RNA helicase